MNNAIKIKYSSYLSYAFNLPKIKEKQIESKNEYTTFSYQINNVFFLFFLLLFKYSYLHFPATTSPCLTHRHLPPSILPPFSALSMGPLYMLLDEPSPSFPHYHLPSFPPVAFSDIGILMEITLNLYIVLGNMDVLTILILPIHECKISFHSMVSF